MWTTFPGTLRRFLRRRPTIEPQVQPADCGYVCASAVLGLLGVVRSVAEIKQVAGETTRGLSLRQLRDVLAACGVKADAVHFDRARTAAFPCPGIILLDRGHYVVVADARDDRLEIYDPALGWSWIDRRRLSRLANGFGLHVKGLVPSANQRKRGEGQRPPGFSTAKLFRNAVGFWTVLGFAFAQLIALSLPLLSMRSVDATTDGAKLGVLGAVGLGFVLVSATSAITNFVANLFSHRLTKVTSKALSRLVFDAFAAKPHVWFESNRTLAIQHKISAIEVQHGFMIEVFRTAGSLVITLAVGLLALLYISPWLAVPGLCSLALAIVIELALNKAQLTHITRGIEVAQHKQSFVIDVIGQLPLLARFGSSDHAKRQYQTIVAKNAAIDARIQGLQNWRTLLTGSVKSLETLVFVSIAALFMAKGEFTLGGFVAIGAYKDLLAQSMASAFQLRQRHKRNEFHRMQSADLADAPRSVGHNGRTIREGSLAVSDLSFRYGTLDPAVLSGVSFTVAPGEFVAIRGPSGAGKSTLSKLIAGVITPSSGSVHLDGAPPLHPMQGFAAVLQSDRLVAGSVRDNITLFRRGVSESDIYEALRVAELDEFVKGLPMRLNTFVAEGLTGLSGGQRQRLLIARASLQAPRVILLDEATSSLEVEIEAKILGNLKATGASLIVVAHRPEVWSLADNIISIGTEPAHEDAKAGAA